MELFHKRKDFITFPIFFFINLVIHVHCATILYEHTPKDTQRILGDKFIFSLKFTGDNEKRLRSYAFVNVSVAPQRDSKDGALVLIYSFTVLKKSGVKKGKLGKNHPFHKQISDIKTVKTGETQIFSMKMIMICRLSTNFKYSLVKDSTTSENLGKSILSSYSITSLGIEKQKAVYYPGDKIKVDCQIKKCSNLDTDKNKLKYSKFILTSEKNDSATIPSTNSSTIVMSVHDNVIGTKYSVSKEFVITCAPLHLSCAFNRKTWKTRRLLKPKVDASFCRSEKMEFKVKWGENNYTNNMKYVADGATFTTICIAFTLKNTSIVSEGEPAKLVSRVTLAEETQNVGVFAVKQLITFRNDDAFCYYPRKTFRCYLNDTEEASKTVPVPFRPSECEPKFISFKPKKNNKNELNVICIIRITRGEKMDKTGIFDDNESINVLKKLSNETDYGRNREALIINSNVSFSSCDDLKSRNLTCWYYSDETVFTTNLDLSKICEGASYLWLLWLLLLLLIPLLLLCCFACCLCISYCRRKMKAREEIKEKPSAKKEKKEEKVKKVKKEKAEKEVKEEKKKKEKVKVEKPPKEKPAAKKEKQEEAKRIEARRMYRMFKKRRPFGWRELNDHFLWLSMMAEDEQRTRSLSPSCHEYAKFRLMKKRTRFGNRELMSYSQTMMQQGVRTEEDLATLRDLESCYGNWSQLTVSPDVSNIKDELDPKEKKEAHRQKIISEMYNEGAIGCYNQLESYEYIHNSQNPEVYVKESVSTDSSSDGNSKTNNNQRQSRRRRKWKHRRSQRNDDIA